MIEQQEERVDDTSVHKALREALANCLINADYHGVRGVVIRKEADKITFANPDYVRTGKKQMRWVENLIREINHCSGQAFL